MKTCFRAFCAAFVLLSALCCAGKAEFEDLRRQVVALEQKVDNINKEIDALKTLVMQIKQGGYVTAVLPDERDGRICGYTLAFNDGRSVYLQIGGPSEVEAPQIGVRQAEDGNWYWTVNGEWLLDTDGGKVLASAVSQESVQMKFEGDSWYISYDGGANWERVSTKGSSSGLSFSSVDTSNPDYVVITLTDGTQLRLPTWEAFDALRQLVKQLNINLSSLCTIVSALQENDYLVSMTPFVEDGVPVGWLLNFSKSGLVVIYSSAGDSPHLGVRQHSDGLYYWTIDGEWLLDAEGKMVRAQGSDGKDATAPKLKIEGGDWFVSYDDGETWERLGRASGEDGDSFFREVDVSSDEFVRLVLADGSSLRIPKYVPLDIVLDLPKYMVLGQYEALRIPYEIVGTYHDDVNIAVFVQGELMAELVPDEKVVWVYSEQGHDGTLIIMLSTPNGTTVMKTFTIERRSLVIGYEGFINFYTSLPSTSQAIITDKAGGSLSIVYRSNSPFELDTSELPWVTVEKGYSGSESTIRLKLEPNGDNARSGRLFFTFEEPGWAGVREYVDIDGKSRYYIRITQEGASSGGVTADVLEAVPEHKEYELEIESTEENLTVRPEDGCDWLACRVERKTEKLWTLFVDVQAYSGPIERRADVLVSAGGEEKVAMVVKQRDYDLQEERMIKMQVLALPENDGLVWLPFTGQLSLRVDWGDGCVSVFERGINNSEKPFKHKYQISDGQARFVVSASGKVQKMSSSQIYDYETVESVLQWGADLGLESMQSAFYRCSTLVSVAEDKYEAFRDVSSFSAAFHSCKSLQYVPVNLFDGAYNATNFDKAFLFVKSVTSESPYTVIDGKKIHLYDRPYGPYPAVSNHTTCFSDGHWADQEAIHMAGWD